MIPSPKEIFKIISAVILTAIAVIFAVGFSAFNAAWINKCVAVLTALSALGLWLLDHSRTAYLLWNMLKLSVCSRGTVAWEAVDKFYVNDDFSLEKYFKEYVNDLRISGKVIDVIKESQSNVSFDVRDRKRIEHIKIFLTTKDGMKQLRLKQIANMSYRDSKKQYERFRTLVNRFQKRLAQVDASENLFGGKETYSVSLQFEKHNPFYHFAIRHIDETEIEDFKLTFNDAKMKVKVKKNTLTLISNDSREIAIALKKYIAVSEIN